MPFLLPCSHPTAPALGRGGQKHIPVLTGVTVTGEPELQVNLLEYHTALDRSRILGSSPGAGTEPSSTKPRATAPRALGPLCSLSPNR